MTEPCVFTLQDEIEEAEAAARDLPGQIARVRAHITAARLKLGPRRDEETLADLGVG